MEYRHFIRRSSCFLVMGCLTLVMAGSGAVLVTTPPA